MKWIRDNSIHIAIGTLICLVVVDIVITVNLEQADLTHDPKYGQMIQGNEPMLVQTSKVGDDARPHLHRVWFNPMTEEYYYTVEVVE